MQEQLEELIAQVGEQVFYDPMPDMVGDTYRINITLRMDDKQLRSVISDLGLALNTNTVRSQSFLVLMDEFFTTPTDLRAPLEELIGTKPATRIKKKKPPPAPVNRRMWLPTRPPMPSGRVCQHSQRRVRQPVAAAQNDGQGGKAAVAARDSGRYSAASGSTYQAAGARSTTVAAASSSSAAYAHQVSAEEHDNTYFKEAGQIPATKYRPGQKNYVQRAERPVC